MRDFERIVSWVAEHIDELQSLLSRSRPSQEASMVEGMDHMSPEVYVAKPWSAYGDTGTAAAGGGMPAMTNASDTGTGTLDYPIPGLALCAIYKLDVDPFGAPLLIPLGGRNNPQYYVKWVYNVYASSSDTYFPVMRDKFGKWLALLGGGGGGELIRFKIIASGPPYLQASQTCTTVLGEVQDIGCTGATVAVGDEIILWDPWGCWLSVPFELLEGMYGFATKFTKNPAYSSECANDDPNEACFWNIVNLCCLEEVFV